MGTARDRLVRAAFDLFASDGFEQTTVEQIAARAGVGRTTFFRHFPAKESVIFPDHEAILAAVDGRLTAGGPAAAGATLYDAALIVLRHYLEEGELARERYRLTRTVAALRDAEIAGQRRYQRLFRRHLDAWLAADGRPDPLLAEVLANAVVTAHNHVLRSWLRGDGAAPEEELRTAVVGLAARLWRDDEGLARTAGTDVVVLRTAEDLGTLLPRLERLLQGGV